MGLKRGVAVTHLLGREMFQRLLTEGDKLFSNNLHTEFTLNQWRERQHLFLPIFSGDIKPLVDICTRKPFNHIFEFSKSEYIISQLNSVLIIEFRIRPQNQYYETLQKPIPQPDNRSGPHSTGTELCIGVYRGISKDKVIYPPFVEINLDKYQGTDIIRKLDLYVSNKQDPEAYFSLAKTFNKNAEFDRVAKVLRNLLIVYYCCYGYCQERKELDRILDFSEILAN